MTIRFFEDSRVVNPAAMNLSWHGFADGKSNISQPEFLEQLSGISPDINELNLSANQFGLCNIEFLLKMLEQIKRKEHIVKLDLSFNKLEKMKFDDLLKFLNNIPSSVTELDLYGNFNHFSEEELIRVNKALPPGVTGRTLERLPYEAFDVASQNQR